jgi:endoglucanase
MRSRAFLFVFLFLSASLYGQAPQCPFQRGFNLGGWLQADSAKQIRNSYTKTVLENMISLGADHVRVPINLYGMGGRGPDYTIDPILLLYVDRAVDWAEELGLYIILDNHSLAPALASDPERTQRLTAVWRQMAEHFKDRSALVLYEILNEPAGIDDAVWGEMQRQAIAAIRAVDPVHTVIVSPGSMGSYDHLALLPRYADPNLIYTFHFYDPFLFTHQGSNWTDPSMENVRGVPYPYDVTRMPSMPANFAGTWLQDQWNWYPSAGSKTSLQYRMSIAVQFRNDRQVPIYCGEFGALQGGSSHADRVQWYTDMGDILAANGIAWALWGYQGGFGIFKEGSNGVFPSDLDTPIVTALDFNVPAAVAIGPDTAGMVLYDDLMGECIFDAGYSGSLDYYDTADPYDGIHSIHWTGADRYGTISWRFTQARDFSALKNGGYRVSFWLKTDTPGLRFDVRFLDTDLGDGQDHPWRMTKTIDNTVVSMDGNWHQVEFALSAMADSGSWHNNAWYNPEGKFDWTRIDVCEVVAEHHDLYGKHVYLDDVQIVKPALVRR